jgi:uncharacterized protein (TIGR02594 family)
MNNPLYAAVLMALQWYGETPIAGPQANENILAMLAATSYPKGTSDEVPWCSAFLIWIFEKCGIATNATAAAQSWQAWGASVIDPALGDIVVLGWNDMQGVHRHVGLFIREVEHGIYILAGNQDNTVDIALWKKKDVLAYRTVA